MLIEKRAVQAGLLDRLRSFRGERVLKPWARLLVGRRWVADRPRGPQIDALGARLPDHALQLLFVDHQMQQRLAVVGLLGALDAVVDRPRDEILDAVEVDVVQVFGAAHIAVAWVRGLAQHLII
jgi:hypothetical protein